MFTASRALKVLGAQAPFINYVVCLGVVRGIQDAAQALAPVGVVCCGCGLRVCALCTLQ